jgi:hypothetical protein
MLANAGQSAKGLVLTLRTTTTPPPAPLHASPATVDTRRKSGNRGGKCRKRGYCRNKSLCRRWQQCSMPECWPHIECWPRFPPAKPRGVCGRPMRTTPHQTTPHQTTPNPSAGGSFVHCGHPDQPCRQSSVALGAAAAQPNSKATATGAGRHALNNRRSVLTQRKTTQAAQPAAIAAGAGSAPAAVEGRRLAGVLPAHQQCSAAHCVVFGHCSTRKGCACEP